MASYLKKYYDVLGLQQGASQTAIKKAYFKLAKQYHPDINPSKDAQQKFVEVNKAYEILSNPDLIKKALYRAYSTQRKKKAQQKQKRKQAADIHKRTQRRASMSSRQFRQKTPKEILIRDLKRMLDYFLVLSFFFMLTVALGTYVIVKEKGPVSGVSFFVYGLLFTLAVAAVTFFIPITLIIIRYFQTRSKSDS